MHKLTEIATPPLPELELGKLTAFAAECLLPMFDPAAGLFCHRLKLAFEGLVREGVSRRYTAMTLLGLHRYEAAGGNSPIKVQAVVDSFLGDFDWVDNIGDAGLVLWLAARVEPDRVREVFSRLGGRLDLAQSREGRQARTMELAWLLSGLSYAVLAYPQGQGKLSDLAETVFRLLKGNLGRSGLFGHQAVERSVRGVLRGRIGSFADQVYPIYALTQYAKAFGVPGASDIARNCAEVLCGTQGSLGQWWWHYDSSSGHVVQRYPVYSVHQEGMAPMALLALDEGAQLGFAEAAVYRGLAWIAGRNEICLDMRDAGSAVIWRNVHRRKWLSNLQDVLSRSSPESGQDLEVLLECRPYELGWLLYAFGGRTGCSRPIA